MTLLTTWEIGWERRGDCQSSQMVSPFQQYAANGWGEDEVAAVSLPIKKKREYSLITKCIAEFIGDFTFVFVGSFLCFSGEEESFPGTMQAYVIVGQTSDNLVHAALAHGFAIFILVATMGHIRCVKPHKPSARPEERGSISGVNLRWLIVNCTGQESAKSRHQGNKIMR